MDPCQLVHPTCGTQLVEQPTAADGLQLAGITDQHDTPALRVGEADELVDGGGADRAGFVDDHRRSRR